MHGLRLTGTGPSTKTAPPPPPRPPRLHYRRHRTPPPRLPSLLNCLLRRRLILSARAWIIFMRWPSSKISANPLDSWPLMDRHGVWAELSLTREVKGDAREPWATGYYRPCLPPGITQGPFRRQMMSVWAPSMVAGSQGKGGIENNWVCSARECLLEEPREAPLAVALLEAAACVRTYVATCVRAYVYVCPLRM